MKKEYYNEYGRRVTEYVEDGRTLFFKNLNEAINKGVELHTYHYEMFNDKMEFIGYGVPRK